MSYRRIFDPPLVEGGPPPSTGADRYHYTEDAVLVVNVALATGRPILVRGESGTGKSSMARDAALVLGRRLECHVITSSTTAEDLRWQIDHVKRLALAQTGGQSDERLDLTNFVIPGPLWWSFDPVSAQAQHRRAVGADRHDIDPESGGERPLDPEADVVLLLDEIDKADSDLANALLEPLEEGRFSVPVLDQTVRAAPVDSERAGNGPGSRSPLIFVTTNEERRLPNAFLRRCLELRLGLPDRTRMEAIAREKGLATHFDGVWSALFGESTAMTISTAEFLDTLLAYDQLGQAEPSLLDALQRVTAWKHGRTKPADVGR